MRRLGRLLRYTRSQRGVLLGAYLAMIILNLATVFYAALVGPVLQFVFTADFQDILMNAQGELRPAWTLLPHNLVETLHSLGEDAPVWVLPPLLLAIALMKGIGQAGQFYLFGRVSQQVLILLRNDLFAAMLRHNPDFFAFRNQGDLLSRLNHDTQHVEQAFFYGLGALLRDTVGVLFLLAFVIYSDPTLSLVTLITIPVAVLPLTRFASWLKKVSSRGQSAQGAITSAAHEVLGGIRIVQAFTNEKLEQKRFHEASRNYNQQMLRSYLIRAVRTPTMEILGTAVLAILIGVLAHYVRAESADPAHYISFLGALFLMYDPLKRLGNVSDYLATGMAAAERIFEIMDCPPAVHDPQNATALEKFSDSIRFREVSFSHHGKPGQRTIDNVSLTIHKGDTVALVGASGSGKSTLADLLLRFFDVDKGSIQIDGVDLRRAQLQSLRHQIALVSQDTTLFNKSVAENIAYGRPGASRSEIRAAAQKADAESFIQELPEQFDTIIGERGITLSGGQRQRLAIARAFLSSAPILILDEATSNLDQDSERVVQRAINQLLHGKTALVIAHRLTTVRDAKRIYVLKQGSIIEEGSHGELVRQGGEYARLYGQQEQKGASRDGS